MPAVRTLRGLVIGLTLVGFAPAEAAVAAPGQKQVLVLYSASRGAQIVAVADRLLPRILQESLPEGVDYYSEFMDQSRLSEADYGGAFRDFLRLKYGAHVFDLVIAMDNAALEFIEQHRTDLLPASPVVFFTSRPWTRRLPNSTGVSDVLNFSDTLMLAAELQPEIRNVFVVGGMDRTYETLARAQFQRFEPGLSFTYLSGLPTADLEARLSTLPGRSVVYYLHVARDGADENFNPLEYLGRIARVANAPIYCWVDSAMDRGIVGGSLRSLEAQVKEIAGLAVRVLRGTPADDLPVSAPDLNVREVDWRQLQRWGISERRVPAGTTVRFREPSPWDRYRSYILGSLVILLAQTVLITGLLVQRARRRQAEAQVRAGQAELRTSYERIRDLGARLLHAQETERSFIARELHDDISQQLALLAIDLEMQGGASDALARANSVARSVRDLSHRLHPARLRLIGLVAALQALRLEVAHSGIEVSFTHHDVPSPLPLDLTLCLFRVAQEALQNAVKYSRAANLSVHLAGGPDGLGLTIMDDGVGFDVAAAWGKGLGLISMRERLEAIGGTLEVQSAPDTGTRIEARVPASAVHDTTEAAV